MAKVTDNALFKSLKPRMDAQPSLAGKLAVLDTAKGFYPGDAKEMQVRSTLFQIAMQPAVGKVSAIEGFTLAADDVNTPGEIAVSVLTAALVGAVDKGAWSFGVLPKAGYIQKGDDGNGVVSTSMSLTQALSAVTQVDLADQVVFASGLAGSVAPAKAADIVLAGAGAAAKANNADYAKELYKRAGKAMGDFLNPFGPDSPFAPIGSLVTLAVAGVVLVLVLRLFRK